MPTSRHLFYFLSSIPVGIDMDGLLHPVILNSKIKSLQNHHRNGDPDKDGEKVHSLNSPMVYAIAARKRSPRDMGLRTGCPPLFFRACRLTTRARLCASFDGLPRTLFTGIFMPLSSLGFAPENVGCGEFRKFLKNESLKVPEPFRNFIKQVMCSIPAAKPTGYLAHNTRLFFWKRNRPPPIHA